MTPGNLVGHDLDLVDVGVEKVSAMRERLQRINPYVETLGRAPDTAPRRRRSTTRSSRR